MRNEKNKLRREVKARIAALSAFDREESAARACALLQSQRAWENARTVLFYAPLPQELNIWALVPEALKQNKQVILPRFDSGNGSYHVSAIKSLNDLVPGQFGINEPRMSCAEFPLNQLDLTLVPGIAFDLRGGRLGRGGGYYDRLLAQVSGTKCGVAFDEQVVAEVPVEPHDILLDCILTPTRWWAASRRAV